MNRHFSKDKHNQEAHKKMLNITKIKKCKLKPRYHLTLVRMAIVNRITNNKCW